MTQTRVAKEIDRLLALGRRADIGQAGVESWTVRADREGNEFCVGAPEGNAHPLGLSTEHGRQTLSAAEEDVLMPFSSLLARSSSRA